MENKEAHEILIVDDNSDFREKAAVALHRAFGTVPIEEILDRETLENLDWSKVRTVVTNGKRHDYKRLHFLLTLIRQHPQITLLALNLEQNQMQMDVILQNVGTK